MTVTVKHGDCREVIKTLAEASVHAVVTDPPYSLVSIQKRFGKPGQAPAQHGIDGLYRRASAGFMGQQWDTGETAHDPAFWAEVYRVLKPGAHLVAFGGTRSHHRQWCAIEDAGFEVRDTIRFECSAETKYGAFIDGLSTEQCGVLLNMLHEASGGSSLAWHFGSGFPKSHNVGIAIDKTNGAAPRGKAFNMKGRGARAEELNANGREFPPAYEPIADAAREWEGWGTALKPAFEPIVLARKPLIGTVAANVLQHGTGALNIDGCRIETDANLGRNNHARTGGTSYLVQHEDRFIDNSTGKGRWPANLCHDGSEEVLAAFPDTGTSSGGKGEASKRTALGGHIYGDYSHATLGGNAGGLGDCGSAARFFYSAKADKDDRADSRHPTVKPVALMRWLVRLITPPGGLVLDPFAGSGTTGVACIREGFDCILIEREAQYVADIRHRLAKLGGLDTPLLAGAAT